jgi:hypothetical protein
MKPLLKSASILPTLDATEPAQVLQQGFDWKGEASLTLFGVVVAVAVGVGLVWALVDR